MRSGCENEIVHCKQEKSTHIARRVIKWVS
jgi:hypothetical protein